MSIDSTAVMQTWQWLEDERDIIQSQQKVL